MERKLVAKDYNSLYTIHLTKFYKVLLLLLFILFIVRCGSLIGPYRLCLLLQGKSSCAYLEAKTSQVYKKNALPKANSR